jgi:Protein of unknown function (DUF3304)
MLKEKSRSVAATRFLVLAVLSSLVTACAMAPKGELSDIAQARKENPERWAEIDRQSALMDAQRKEVSYVSMTCVTHGVRIGQFYVEEVAHGQNIGEQGGSFSCGGLISGGYPVPKQWVPGLTVRVRWTTFDVASKEFSWHEKYTTIAPYAEVGSLWVHFFPQDEVRVVVSNIGASGPEHPIVFGVRVPPPEDPSHVPVPIVGVNLECAVHGDVSVAPGTEISLDNPNFSNPRRQTFYLNYRDLPVYFSKDSSGRDLIGGCRGPAGLQIDKTWQPHKKVMVFWRRNATPEEAAKQKRDEYIHVEKMLSVPRYDKPTKAWLHLFPNDQARLVFSDEPPDSPKHPIARDALVPPAEEP